MAALCMIHMPSMKALSSIRIVGSSCSFSRSLSTCNSSIPQQGGCCTALQAARPCRHRRQSDCCLPYSTTHRARSAGSRPPCPAPAQLYRTPTCLIRFIDLRTFVRREGSGMRCCAARYMDFSPCSRVRSLSRTNLRAASRREERWGQGHRQRRAGHSKKGMHPQRARSLLQFVCGGILVRPLTTWAAAQGSKAGR